MEKDRKKPDKRKLDRENASGVEKEQRGSGRGRIRRICVVVAAAAAVVLFLAVGGIVALHRLGRQQLEENVEGRIFHNGEAYDFF